MVWPHPPVWIARRLPRLPRPRRLRRVIVAPQAGHLRRRCLDAPPVELRDEEEEEERIVDIQNGYIQYKYFNFYIKKNALYGVRTRDRGLIRPKFYR
jgi:hypothetical protein